MNQEAIGPMELSAPTLSPALRVELIWIRRFDFLCPPKVKMPRVGLARGFKSKDPRLAAICCVVLVTDRDWVSRVTASDVGMVCLNSVFLIEEYFCENSSRSRQGL